jgi:CHASE2 domain-containing sensor protein
MSDSNTGKITVRPETSLLGVLFVGLKLTGQINWPWVWVVAPFWIPIAFSLIILLLASVLYIIAKNQKKY